MNYFLMIASNIHGAAQCFSILCGFVAFCMTVLDDRRLFKYWFAGFIASMVVFSLTPSVEQVRSIAFADQAKTITSVYPKVFENLGKEK